MPVKPLIRALIALAIVLNVMVIVGLWKGHRLYQNRIYNNASVGTKYNLSLWHFHDADDRLVFAIGTHGCSSDTRMTIRPGIQAALSKEYYVSAFQLSYRENWYRVDYCKPENTVTIGNHTYDLEKGTIFMLLPSATGICIEQVALNGNSKHFGVRSGVDLLDAVGARLKAMAALASPSS